MGADTTGLSWFPSSDTLHERTNPVFRDDVA